MSHIPAAAMPHARSQDGPTDNQADQPRSAPEAMATGARSGHTEPTHAGSVSRAHGSAERSPLVIAALVLGGLAAVGGLVAAVLPLLSPKEKPKSRKRKRRKSA